MRPTLISFDLRAEFGVFKKPDVNEGLQPTFNMLHKPALLGILGAIAGLEGYQRRGEFPSYFRELRGLKVGIQPLDHENGNFTKTVIKYTNTVGYANADGNLIVTEQTLHKPAYRCFLMPDLDHPVQALLHDRILAGEAEYLPYFGKNECSAWWDNADTHPFTQEPPSGAFELITVFNKKETVVNDQVKDKLKTFGWIAEMAPNNFIYFEKLPVDFNEQLFQYQLEDFAFTNFRIKPTAALENLYYLSNENKYVQLF